MIVGKTTGVPYEPTPEQIAERAKEVREQGFPSRGGKGQRIFNPPWREMDYFRRAGMLEPVVWTKTYRVTKSNADETGFDVLK